MDYSPVGYELDRTMRVIKMRGSDHDSHPYRLTIQPGGLQVEKLSAAEYKRQARPSITTEAVRQTVCSTVRCRPPEARY
jgi:KaiC/GvpD/RAD55 family RecA-like ATPase